MPNERPSTLTWMRTLVPQRRHDPPKSSLLLSRSCRWIVLCGSCVWKTSAKTTLTSLLDRDARYGRSRISWMLHVPCSVTFTHLSNELCRVEVEGGSSIRSLTTMRMMMRSIPLPRLLRANREGGPERDRTMMMMIRNTRHQQLFLRMISWI